MVKKETKIMAKFAYNKKCNNQKVSNKMVLFFMNLVVIYSILTVSITETKSDKMEETLSVDLKPLNFWTKMHKKTDWRVFLERSSAS